MRVSAVKVCICIDVVLDFPGKHTIGRIFYSMGYSL
jgi:hypothetical protein